ncbi:MAG: TetR/AcrR family transcriptional regulator [Actinomycetota bacterium]|nr:TetR/AcrR family transcriptional regulator [Actinomycetota bacterium]
MTTALPRGPQQDRSRLTRRRLLEATVSSLAQVGWTATSVSMVAARAGVSRGAAQHHFPTRESLFEAVIDHITSERLAELTRAADGLPVGRGRTEAVLNMIVSLYTGPLFRAALQVWTAASSEDALRARLVPLEADVGRRAHRVAVELLGADESVPGMRETVQATLDLARGLGLADVLHDDSRRRRRVIRHWARILDGLLQSEG